MYAAFYTLIVVLAASGMDGTKVLVSIPEGEADAQRAQILEAIANISTQEKKHWEEHRNIEKKHWKELESKLKVIEDTLNVRNGSASKLKEKPASTSEPTLVSSP